MTIDQFRKLFTDDPLIRNLAEQVGDAQKGWNSLKGLRGSMDALVGTAVYLLTQRTQLFVLHDKEEAAYFHNDLQSLLPEKEILLFPTSYKKPYEVEHTDNANVLQRGEVLNQLNASDNQELLIVTYPDALHEKVIHKSALTEHTLTATVGETLQPAELSDRLQNYGFERTDFVYEPGQFAMRGGIIDIFSYAHDMPYRIELFGNDIESIRLFDPESQLSEEKVTRIRIIPNIQTRLLDEDRQSFFSFLPENSLVWFKDYQQVLDTIQQYLDRAQEAHNHLDKQSESTLVVRSPEFLFESPETFESSLTDFTCLEFGTRFYHRSAQVFEYAAHPQPSFNKNFEIISDNLEQYQHLDYRIFLVSDAPNQLDKLIDIFEETRPHLKLHTTTASLRGGFIDDDRKIVVYTDHQMFERFHRFKSATRFSRARAMTLRELRALQPGDYVTHIDYGIGKFAGLDKVEVNGRQQEALRLIYRDNDLLYVSVQSLHKISRYSGKEGQPPVMSKLGSQEWEQKKKRVKRNVKDIASDLIKLYAKRKAAPGYAFPKDTFLEAELETSFIYEDTPDQAQATSDVKADMQQPHPMDRLVCGDVGFGKTEVAIRAAFKAVNNGKQVAILVPTTILAFQHFRTFRERLENFAVRVAYISRFSTSKKAKALLNEVEEGKVDILIGTHRLVNKDVKFKDLGLLVIDEEQKFGVRVKERLKEFKVNVDVLTLTATPIPRTLHFSLMGARDLSIIATPPPNRQPVATHVHTFNEEVIRDAISFELKRGGQVFFVHNRIQDIEEIANIIFKLIPDARIAVAHGQMEGSKLERAMLQFIEGEYDVLVSTNIIESGLDIPNANTIIINQAHMFGLSDLHQMRGRVGRSNKKAFCYLLAPPTVGLTADARKRLITLEEFSELGDGFKVAMRDLDIRGAGNLLGAEQSGFITDLGFETYHKILDETVQELKETEFRSLFEDDLKEKIKPLVQDCVVETDLELLIPENYVTNISERLRLYSQLDNIATEKELEEFIAHLKDRFGNLPEVVLDLIEVVRLRWLAEKAGVERLHLKNNQMKCYLVAADQEDYYKSPLFGNILQYVQQHSRRCKLRDTKNGPVLTIYEIAHVDQAKAFFEQLILQPSQ